MNATLKKIDELLDIAAAEVEVLKQKQVAADASKLEHMKKNEALNSKEKELIARAEVIQKYEDLDLAIKNNAITANELSKLDAELKADRRNLSIAQAALAKDKAEVDEMNKVLKTKDQNLDKAKESLLKEKEGLQDKILEEIKKKLLK